MLFVWTREHGEAERLPFAIASLIAILAGVSCGATFQWRYRVQILVYYRLPKAIQIYCESTPGMEEMMPRERMLDDDQSSEDDEDNG